ncbi:MAG: hypothetical protein K2J13_00365, partial [Clostridia bacterium]|nr:hypothetical protein [Clostridia bacterium]
MYTFPDRPKNGQKIGYKETRKMDKNRQIYKRNSKLLLTISLCLVLALCCIALYFNIGRESKQEAQAETNTPSFVMGAPLQYDTNKGNGSSVVSLNSIAHSSLSACTDTSDISASQTDNIVQILSKYNLHYEVCYADVTASITVPAWREYKIKYTIQYSKFRTGSGIDNGTGCEIFDFNGSTINGKDANITFNTSSSSTSSTYSKGKYFSENTTKYSGTYTTVELTYANYSGASATYEHNFGVFAFCRATKSVNTYVTADFTFGHEMVADNKLTITQPEEDKTKYEYTGTQQTYSPIGWDADKMELTEDSDSMTQTNAGSYTIKIVPKNNCPWDDMTTNPVELPFIIHKASPNAQPQYEQKSDRYISEGLPTLTNIAGGVAGAFSWGSQTPVLGSKEYT